VRAVVVGATAGLGRALTVEVARRGGEVVLVGRDAADLKRAAADIAARFRVPVTHVVSDGTDPTRLGADVAAICDRSIVDVLLLPIGVSVDDDAIDQPVERMAELLSVNLLAVMAASSVAAERMRAQGHGVIVGFSSVAATRGRARNAAYAVAKRGLESWFESLRASLAGSGVEVGWYVLGYLATNLSFGQQLPLPVADVETVAARIVDRLPSTRGRRYAPFWWRPVSLVIRLVPFPIFRRLKG
jgi:short-subunit dehydrogenase